ncbi:MAG TPA: hypothetical protein VLS89_06755, partial [Candidatus Nanopelagicales bacterium]|nr:hypothetical protein [Candidatus Nanopelagicales bacterium]
EIAWLASPARHAAPGEALLGALGALHVRGATINWPSFDAPHRRRRVALPTYAFQRRRHWLELTPASAPTGHPLLGEALPALAHLPEMRAWQARLDLRRLERLAEAQIEHITLLSLGSFIELAEAAGMTSGGLAAVDLMMAQPLALPADRAGALQIVENTLPDGGRTAQLFHQAAHDAPWREIARGAFRLAPAGPAQVDLPALRARCAKEISPALLPAAIAPWEQPAAPRRITRLFRGGDEILAELPRSRHDGSPSLTEAIRAAVEATVAARLNTAKAPGAALPQGSFDWGQWTAVELFASTGEPSARAIPVVTQAHRARIHPGAGRAAFLHAKKRHNGGARLGLDVQLLTDDGAVIVSIEGLDLELLDPGSLLGRLRGPDLIIQAAQE